MVHMKISWCFLKQHTTCTLWQFSGLAWTTWFPFPHNCSAKYVSQVCWVRVSACECVCSFLCTRSIDQFLGNSMLLTSFYFFLSLNSFFTYDISCLSRIRIRGGVGARTRNCEISWHTRACTQACIYMNTYSYVNVHTYVHMCACIKINIYKKQTKIPKKRRKMHRGEMTTSVYLRRRPQDDTTLYQKTKTPAVVFNRFRTPFNKRIRFELNKKIWCRLWRSTSTRRRTQWLAAVRLVVLIVLVVRSLTNIKWRSKFP